MSDGDWRDNAAIRGLIAAAGAVGILALLAVVVLTVQGEQRERSPTDQAAYAEPHDAQALLRACRGFHQLKQPPTPEQCADARDEADLNAQQGMFATGVAQSIISAISLALLGLTVLYAHRAWQEAKRGASLANEAAIQTKRQADATEAQLADSRQPFLWVDVQTYRIENTPKPHVRLRVKNVGDRTAAVIGGRVALIFNQGIPRFPRRRKDFADSYVITVESRALAPSDWLAADAWANAPFTSMPAEQRLWLYGWVDYRDYAGAEGVLAFAAFYSSARSGEPGRFIDVDVSASGRRILTYSEELREGLPRTYAEAAGAENQSSDDPLAGLTLPPDHKPPS